MLWEPHRQDTLIGDLRDTFSLSEHLTGMTEHPSSLLQLNTATYSITRTAQCIDRRLQDAASRLHSI